MLRDPSSSLPQSHNEEIVMFKRLTLLAVFAFSFTLGASAQSTFHKAFLSSLDQANEKVVSLAGAFSEDQYSWRPAEGVRSVSEAMMHVANANFFFGGQLGGEVPEMYKGRNLEKEVTTKAEAVKTLEASIKFVRDAVKGVSVEALDEEIDMFGNKAPRLSMVLLVGDHANEHLGQLIAYARSSGVVPPWSN